MAKSPERVMKFLEEIKGGLESKAQSDKETLLQLKKECVGDLKLEEFGCWQHSTRVFSCFCVRVTENRRQVEVLSTVVSWLETISTTKPNCCENSMRFANGFLFWGGGFFRFGDLSRSWSPVSAC